MKIIFICGCLEPGRDGVGDYTRRLAGELIRQGHQASAVAINDREILEGFEGFQEMEMVKVPVLRVPSVWSEKLRFSRTKEWVDMINPEWLSLQFVPYSFHRKGVPFEFFKSLSSFEKKYQWHIMFHEIWIGADKTLKNKIIFYLQKTLVIQFVRFLKPKLIHTHLPTYKLKLEKLGFKVKILPLFSNIEVSMTIKNKNRKFKVGFFSQIGYDENIILFLAKMASQMATKGIKTEILLIGGKKDKIHSFKCILEQLECFKENIIYTGFLNSNDLSKALNSCNIGITPVPRHGLGKSGSVAAFIAHGVPVAAPVIHPKYDPMEIGFLSSSLCSSIILEPEFQNIKIAEIATLDARNEIMVTTITNKMLYDMEF